MLFEAPDQAPIPDASTQGAAPAGPQVLNGCAMDLLK